MGLRIDVQKCVTNTLGRIQGLRLFIKKNGGLSSARNAGLEIATGKYIGFVDSDDFIESSMYESLIKQSNLSSNVGIIECSVSHYTNGKYKYWGGTTNGIRIIPSHEFLYNVAVQKITNSVWNKIFKNELIKKTPFFRIGCIGEDFCYLYDICEEIEQNKYEIIQIPERLYNYRYNNEGICLGGEIPIMIYEYKNRCEVYGDCSKKGRPESRFFRLGCLRFIIAILVSSLLGDIKSKKYSKEYRKKLSQYKAKELINDWGLRHILLFLLLKYCPQLLHVHKVFNFCTACGVFPPVTIKEKNESLV